MTDEEIVKNVVETTPLICFTSHEVKTAEKFGEEVAIKACKMKEKEMLEKVKEYFGSFIIPCAQKNLSVGCLRLDGTEMIEMFVKQFENE